MGTRDRVPHRARQSAHSLRFSALQSSLKPDNQVLFKRGDIWNEELTITNLQGSSASRYIGTYSLGARPIIEGGSTRHTCINAISTTAKYITIDGFECRNPLNTRLLFRLARSKCLYHGAELHIHKYWGGPRAYAGRRRGARSMMAQYRNQLDSKIIALAPALTGVKFINNVVITAAHNCLQVH